MKPNDFRRIALAMPDAIEKEHMGHPDFRANGRIFATLAGDGKRGMVKLTPDQQMQFMLAKPGMFEPASGAWGRQGCTMVSLAVADEETIGEAMTLAWQGSLKVKSKKAKGKRQNQNTELRSSKAGPATAGLHVMRRPATRRRTRRRPGTAPRVR